MKNLKVLIALFIVGLLLLNPTIVPANPEIKFDKAIYEREIKRRFDSTKVMGYQIILLKKEQFISELADGLARNAADGSVKMTLDTPGNIGSTAKFFAGTALLQKLQMKGDLEMQLNQYAYKYFPKIWQDNMHESIKKIRFGDLLRHEGGFIHSDPDPNIKVYFDYLKKGVSLKPTTEYAYGKRNYANANITTIGYVLAAVDDPEFLMKINKKIAFEKLAADDPKIQAYLGLAFENYMEANIFSKIKPAISPSCDATNEYPKKNIIYAKMYEFPTTQTAGAEFTSKKNGGMCHSAGGWYITGRELASYAANFAGTDLIVNQSTRDLMFNDDAANDRLLWSMTRNNPTLLKNFGWNTSPFMGGDHSIGKSSAHATIVQLPGDYYAVGIVNSDIMNDKGEFGGSNLLTWNIIEAFNAGVAANF